MSQVAIMPGRPTVVAQTPSDMMEALRNHGWLQDKKENTSPLMGCIGPMLEAIEWGGDLRQLCDALPYAYERFGLLDFLNVMAALGYKNAAIKSNIREVDGALVPALFIPQDDGAPLVLSEITREGIVVINGDGGKRENWQAKNLKGTLYIFTPIQKESQAEMQARTRVGRTWFRERIERFLPMLWPVLILGVVISFVTLSVPLFVMMVYDKVINAQSLPTLKYFVIGAAIAIGAEIMLRYLRVHALAWFGARLNNIISVGIFERLLYLPPSVTEGVSIASQLARIKAFEQVRDFFTGTMFALILETPFVFVMMLGIWWVAGPLVCISVFITGCYIALLFAMHRKFKMLSFRHAKAGSDKQKIVVEMFSKLPVIKYNGMVESWRDRYRQISVDYSLSGFRSTFTAAVVEHVAYALMLIAVVATITLGIERIWAVR